MKDKIHPLVREKRKPSVECAVREELQVEAFRSIYQPKFFNEGKMHRSEKCKTSVRFLSTVKESTLFFFLLLPLTIRELVDASQLLTRCKKKKKSRLDLRREGGNGKWFLVIRGRCCLAVGKHPWTILKRLCFSLAVVPLARRQETQYEWFCVCVCEFGHVRSWNVLIFISDISRLFNCGEFVLNHVK